MTLAKAQHYIDNCRSRRRRYYQVLVTEVGPKSPESLKATEDISQWAYQRALAALEQCHDAVGAIGLQSNLLRLVKGGAIVPIRMAAAALVQRTEPESPVILVTSNAGLDNQAKLVAQALSAWRTHEARNVIYGGPIIETVAKRVIGLR